ncbi:MAG: TrbG/VirB9 family P-type conjugative transfer protein [Deltaproteobacteria bacterium]|nr:TrbG/VirB9 family P-type conjugative transfer protein [Deltaproteobacteria bacterium]
MKHRVYILSFLLLCLLSGKAYPKRLKSFEIYRSSIPLINTAPGYTTLLKLGSKPTHVILGNAQAYKIEFLGNNVAVKPLSTGIQTNLFIFTKEAEYRCTLKSGPPEQVNYVVELTAKPFTTTKTAYSQARDNLNFSLKKIKKYEKSSRREIFFTLHNINDEPLTFIPHNFQIRANSESQLITEVYLDHLTLETNQKMNGHISFYILSSNDQYGLVLELVFSGGMKKTFSLPTDIL